MADIAARSGIKIASSNNYDFDCVEGRLYWFEVFYDTGATGDVTVQQGGDDIKDSAGNVIFQAATLPTNPAASMVINETGNARGFDLRCSGRKIRFVAGTISGDAYIRFGEVAHGRS